MRMATEDSCRKGIWLREGYLFDLDQVRSQHVHHQDHDEDERLDRELLRHSLLLLIYDLIPPTIPTDILIFANKANAPEISNQENS